MKKVLGSFMMFLLLVCGCSAQKETTPDKKESTKAEVKEECCRNLSRKRFGF